MDLIVRAVDVGSGNTKFVNSVVTSASGVDVRRASFPSVAYPSSDGLPSWPSGDRRKTMFIPIGSLFCEVGPVAALAADTFRAKQLHNEYTQSPEYMALLRGALGMMKLTHTDLLVVGLGGGALLFPKAMKVAFPRHRIYEVKEPMFANERGFCWRGKTKLTSFWGPSAIGPTEWHFAVAEVRRGGRPMPASSACVQASAGHGCRPPSPSYVLCATADAR